METKRCLYKKLGIKYTNRAIDQLSIEYFEWFQLWLELWERKMLGQAVAVAVDWGGRGTSSSMIFCQTVNCAIQHLHENAPATAQIIIFIHDNW